MTTKKTMKKSNSKTTTKKRTGTQRQSAKPAKSTKTNQSSAKFTARARPPKPNQPKRSSGLDVAVEVLAKAEGPLNAKTIAERVIAAGWKTSGLTPAATLHSAIQREIAKKGSTSRFKKVDRGQFAVNDARTSE